MEARLAAPRAAGVRATLAGQALPSWDGGGKTAANANDNDNASDRVLATRDREGMAAIRDWMAHAGTNDEWRGDFSDGRAQSRALTRRDFLTGTSFALTAGSAEAGGYAALWGRGAISRFDGREGDLTLDGEVTTWTHPGKVEAPYTVCIASASNLTGLVKSSVECRRTGL